MTAIFDVVGSFLIGSMFLLTMMNSMYNIQAYGYNIQLYTSFSEISEDVATHVENDVLSRVGSNVTTRVSAIPVAPTSTSFTFQAELTIGGALTDVLVTMANVNNNLVVTYVPPGGGPAVTYLGPFRLANNGLNMVYLDRNNAVIANPAANDNRIHGIQVTMVFGQIGMQMDYGTNNMVKSVTIWSYFNNLHL